MIARLRLPFGFVEVVRTATLDLRSILKHRTYFALALFFAAANSALAADEELGPSGPFAICRNQTYALCATAQCFVYNKVSYCTCDMKSGDSISMTEKFDHSDVCSLNAAGPQNGYMVSTYSLPQSIVAPNGNQALYTCREPVSSGAYAQCDGGICFTSSSGGTFPGLSGQVGRNQIVCACPITVAEPGTKNEGIK
jgi:hypothetical protein